MRRYSTQLALDSNGFGKSWERGESWDKRNKTRCRRNVSQHCGIPVNGLGRSKGPSGLSQLPNLSGPDRAVRLQPCHTSTTGAAVFPSHAQLFVWENCLSRSSICTAQMFLRQVSRPLQFARAVPLWHRQFTSTATMSSSTGASGGPVEDTIRQKVGNLC